MGVVRERFDLGTPSVDLECPRLGATPVGSVNAQSHGSVDRPSASPEKALEVVREAHHRAKGERPERVLDRCGSWAVAIRIDEIEALEIRRRKLPHHALDLIALALNPPQERPLGVVILRDELTDTQTNRCMRFAACPVAPHISDGFAVPLREENLSPLSRGEAVPDALRAGVPQGAREQILLEEARHDGAIRRAIRAPDHGIGWPGLEARRMRIDDRPQPRATVAEPAVKRLPERVEHRAEEALTVRLVVEAPEEARAHALASELRRDADRRNPTELDELPRDRPTKPKKEGVRDGVFATPKDEEALRASMRIFKEIRVSDLTVAIVRKRRGVDAYERIEVLPPRAAEGEGLGVDSTMQGIGPP